MSDVGLYVDFNGKKNVVMAGDIIKEYPIGGMICEYARLRPTEIKNIIMDLPLFQETNLSEKGAEALLWFYKALLEKYGVVVASMVTTDFSNLLRDFNIASDNELEQLLARYNEQEDAVRKFILKDTAWDEFGIDTIGHAFLTAYYAYADSFVGFKHSFDMLVSEEEFEENQVMAFWKLYGDNVDFQHIDFKIMYFDGGFHSMYTIQSSMSLILFEAAHVMDMNTKFVKCKNCGHYFVPVGRSDSVYCGYPSPQDETKDCRDIGAQATRAKKMKNDTVTQEYRRLYMRIKMAIKRHPEDKELKTQLEILTEGMKERRKQVKCGETSPDDILEWLATLDEVLST